MHNSCSETVEGMIPECPHDFLYFGSGGFYIFCKQCSQSWHARKRQESFTTFANFQKISGEAVIDLTKLKKLKPRIYFDPDDLGGTTV